MLFDNIEKSSIVSKRQSKKRVKAPKEKVAAFVAKVKNDYLQEKADYDFEKRVEESLRKYPTNYNKDRVSKLFREVIVRLWKDSVFLDMLICNDNELNDSADQQIRALRYIIRSYKEICSVNPMVRAGSPFEYLCRMASVGSDLGDGIDSLLLIKKWVKELERLHLIKRVGEDYVIIHSSLLGGIWDDDDARYRKAKQIDEESEQAEKSECVE